jgi:hypothetical protein
MQDNEIRMAAGIIALAATEYITAESGETSLTVALQDDARLHYKQLIEADLEMMAEVIVMSIGVSHQNVEEASDYLGVLAYEGSDAFQANPEEVEHLNRCLELAMGEAGQ